MARDEALRYAVGLGARRGIAAEEIVALVRGLVAKHGADLSRVSLCTLESKADEPGVHEAARELGIDVVFLPLEALKARKGAAPTHSPRVQAMLGVGSVAETAALVGAGPGSRLIAPRVATPYAACALAVEAEETE
ncbi:MAG: cobalamin biosynthesis protein CbiG [Methylocystis sp.]|nr:MAG: cobalamin biosynthesis protein CbiG [Methylocystis sp.]